MSSFEVGWKRKEGSEGVFKVQIEVELGTRNLSARDNLTACPGRWVTTSSLSTNSYLQAPLSSYNDARGSSPRICPGKSRTTRQITRYMCSIRYNALRIIYSYTSSRPIQPVLEAQNLDFALLCMVVELSMGALTEECPMVAAKF